MPSPEELARLIRFNIDTLSESNAHHEFEELCRHIALARIATNVIPATGPVGAAGDQGRDLETFRTYLLDELGPNGSFLAGASGGTIAFACTLQKNGLTAKILSDINTILGSGSKVEQIYVFLGTALAVGIRHDLQGQVRDAHGINIEILDAVWIAQELSKHDTFWIAERYLSLPADFAPSPGDDDSPEWYRNLRHTWQSRTPTNTLGDLLLIKSGLRHATFHRFQRQDLPFWLSLMRIFLEETSDKELVRRARYEISVATLRGAGDLTPVDALASEFLNAACDASQPFILEDGGVLLMYCHGAFMRAKTGMSADQLATWNMRLRERTKMLLNSDPSPNHRAMLLSTLGMLNLQPNAHRIVVREGPVRDVADFVEENSSFELPDDAIVSIADEVFVDIDAAMEAWLTLIETLDQAPLFPVERFADSFGFLAPILFAHPLYRRLADLIDENVAKSSGQAAAAGRCRDRAIALRRSNNYCAAVREFHRAKIGWWSGDSIRGSLLAMLLIADCYQQLGFLHAAKQSALLTARLASTSESDNLQDLFAAGIMLATHLDYDLGNWFSAASTAEAGLRLHAEFVAPLDPEDMRVTRVMYLLLWIYLSSRDLVPSLAEKVQSLLDAAHMWEELADIINEQAPQTPLEWMDKVGNQLHGEWMGDLKSEVRISFGGLGVTWCLVGTNDQITTRAMHRLAAATQVILVELAGEEMALLRTDVLIRVTVGTTRDDRARLVLSEGEPFWEVELSPWDDSIEDDEETLSKELLAVLMVILGDISLLPMNLFMARIEDAFRDGLIHKIGSGPSFDQLLQWVGHKEYESLRPGIVLPTQIEDARFTPVEHEDLAWNCGPGPTYDERRSKDAIQIRYDKITSQLPLTLARLKNSPDFVKTVAELRRRGWPDWQILLAIANAVINYRRRELGLDIYLVESGIKGDEARAKINELASQPETELQDAIPEENFSLENMEFNRLLSLPLYLRGAGLELHQIAPDTSAILEFLVERYRYSLDDVDHDDPFK
jgi:hypothetical protein